MRNWISNTHQIWALQNDIMKEMKSYQLLPDLPIIEEIIGDLYVGAIKQAYFKGQPMPFNTHELSDFVQQSIAQRKEEDRMANVWDLYNWGTEIMKPGKVDIGEIAINSNRWSNYLIDQFELPVEKNLAAIQIED